MNHYHTELIEDPQWVSLCVEKECSFRDHAQSYVCVKHYSKHMCSGYSCDLIRTMVTRARYQTEASSETQCPVAALLIFQKPQLEFRGPHDTLVRGDVVEMGYGAIECQPNASVYRGSDQTDYRCLILKSSMPVTISLFSTMLTQDFLDQYELVNKNRGLNAQCVDPSLSWMDKIFKLAEEIQFGAEPEIQCPEEMVSVVKQAVLKSTAAIATLYDSRDNKIQRFMKKVARKYNDKHANRAEFHTMMVMLTLCFFPYLKHSLLSQLFNNRTLVLMCFDKTRTRHNQWSSLSTHIHLHVKQPEFATRVLSDTEVDSFLPAVITVTLEGFIANARYPGNAKQCLVSARQTATKEKRGQPRMKRSSVRRRKRRLSAGLGAWQTKEAKIY